MNRNIIGLFSGCGGLDKGFSNSGFDIVWANENNCKIWRTYEQNHTSTKLNRLDLRSIESIDIPDCVGVIGGPPCQSWSTAGKQRGIEDPRGKLFYEYLRVIEDKRPLFFLAENVAGILQKKHSKILNNIVTGLEDLGYQLNYKLINCSDYGIAQDRKRVFFIGYHESINKKFDFDCLENNKERKCLKDAIWDLKDLNDKDKPNHEYAKGGYSSMYLSRNRVRSWNEKSFTIQASGRHAPIHPQANKMIQISRDKWIFDESSKYEYRRLSIRECARIQSFDDDFVFYYNNLNDGYKMIGNAVPLRISQIIATQILKDLF